MDLKYYQQELPNWNRVWKITKEQIDAHKLEYANTGYIIPEVINNSVIAEKPLAIAKWNGVCFDTI